MEITSQIKAIEALKCALLTDIAVLYEQMRRPISAEDRAAPLADALIHLYLLAKRLGLDFAQLDEQAVLKLRGETLNGNMLSAAHTPDTQALLKYLCGAIRTDGSV